MERVALPKKTALLFLLGSALLLTLATAQDTKTRTTAAAPASGHSTDPAKADDSTAVSQGNGGRHNGGVGPKQEMVSFTVNVPLSSLEDPAVGDFFFGDLLSSFGSFFSDLFSVDGWNRDEVEENPYSSAASGVSTSGSYGLAHSTSPENMVTAAGGSYAFTNTYGGSASSQSSTRVGEEDSTIAEDEAFLSYLTSAYRLPGMQSILGSVMGVPFMDMFTAGFDGGSTGMANAGGKPAGNEGAGMFDLIANLLSANPESLVGPDVVSHITADSCLFEIDLKSVPKTASITVGVEGDAVFVEYSNTFSEKSKSSTLDAKAETSAEDAAVNANETGDNAVEGVGEDKAHTGSHSESRKMESAKNLRGSGGAQANVYSYERFTIDPACDYESSDAKAARVEDDKLRIKFPLKKTDGVKTTDGAEATQLAGEDSVEGKTDASTQEEATEAETEHEEAKEATLDMTKPEEGSAPQRLAQKSSSSAPTSHARRRILPLVAAEEF
ncbi:hypothetical protein BESB_063190 [Besnoitia besnoiti]|uniref:SHSP domain-containing protein n=1 Tax=Besnoitia besnoiti TaxID=94643 RepID=A0A2A9MJ77_BESBE|nr:hypothetical protein BESB_063190 [Besnoitia besnoiti]PFH35432.1 hypothetical protein BESB_063190 [Besnoitia besnoiti]